jgi:hypothetical protein
MSPGLRALDVALAGTVLLEDGPRLETRPGAADPGGPGAGAGRGLDALRLAGGLERGAVKARRPTLC